MRKIQFVYFDIGGVLLDFRPYLQTITTKFNVPLEKVKEVFFKYDDDFCRGKLTLDQVEALYQKEFNNFDVTVDFAKDFSESAIPIIPTHTFLKSLLSTHKVGILSNISKTLFPHLIKKQLVPDIKYDAIIESCEFCYIKPEKELFQIAQDKAGVEAKNILLIDDRAINIDAAKNLGWQGFVFDTQNPVESITEITSLL